MSTPDRYIVVKVKIGGGLLMKDEWCILDMIDNVYLYPNGDKEALEEISRRKNDIWQSIPEKPKKKAKSMKKTKSKWFDEE